ncbi:CLUMA_CG020448, isoform A [Clunio marinus]|uniref:Alpha-1,6-mannosyl-glycoprotein 2-beta-N-acetylglucosaminyltransferase n=1 Tax=Clunio marinus TaxID=568069 RepID=A0A1J1J502_9DIPT|nr:CLUMA_CG020448, isoform A [Clunio marinus]
MIFGPKKIKRFSRWPSVELKCSHMLFSKKLSIRRRLFVIIVALLLTFSVIVLVNQSNVINYAYFFYKKIKINEPDLQLVTSWNVNLNSYLQSTKSIRQSVQSINEQQMILNESLFGISTNFTVVIVVQVHRRLSYLRQLVASLSHAKDIEKALLIFSHDYYDDEINQLVQKITFCRVMQIFYPFSIQIYPNEFPGSDPRDCQRNLDKTTAINSKCLNALHPDLYGHYREAPFTQMKHHWWWKLNRIFDQLEVTQNHNGLLLLLEEDYYVAPDFLHVLEQLHERSSSLCSYCNIISLGTYSEAITRINYDQIEISPWITSKHNMGMAFYRETWNEIKSCAKYFCDYDDYNYDWSLQNINYKCLENKLNVMIIRGPRVFHIGECGMHHTKTDCDQLTSKSQQMIINASLSGHLFPRNLKLTRTLDHDDVSDTLKPNGGWADIRDIMLCLNMTMHE